MIEVLIDLPKSVTKELGCERNPQPVFFVLKASKSYRKEGGELVDNSSITP